MAVPLLMMQVSRGGGSGGGGGDDFWKWIVGFLIFLALLLVGLVIAWALTA